MDDIGVGDRPHDVEPASSYFAPIWYQDTANGGPDDQGARADIPLRADYDGDLQHNNNWDNLPDAEALHPFIYYGLVATETHYYLTYSHYHPRDWEQICTGLFTECHEGDMESAHLVVERDDTGYGHVLLLRTHHHGQNSNWTNENDISGLPIAGDIDFDDAAGDVSPVQTETHHHVRIFAEAKGHGLAPCSAAKRTFKPFGILFLSCPDGTGGGFPGGDGLRLVPDPGEVDPYVDGQESSGTASAAYGLEAVSQSLWLWRTQIGDGQLYDEPTAFTYAGDRGPPFATDGPIGAKYDAEQFANDASSGSAPWNETLEGTALGDLFLDPAHAFTTALGSAWTTTYTFHPYLDL